MNRHHYLTALIFLSLLSTLTHTAGNPITYYQDIHDRIEQIVLGVTVQVQVLQVSIGQSPPTLEQFNQLSRLLVNVWIKEKELNRTIATRKNDTSLSPSQMQQLETLEEGVRAETIAVEAAIVKLLNQYQGNMFSISQWIAKALANPASLASSTGASSRSYLMFAAIYARILLKLIKIEANVANIQGSLSTPPSTFQVISMLANMGSAIKIYTELNSTRFLRKVDTSMSIPEVLTLFISELGEEKRIQKIISQARDVQTKGGYITESQIVGLYLKFYLDQYSDLTMVNTTLNAMVLAIGSGVPTDAQDVVLRELLSQTSRSVNLLNKTIEVRNMDTMLTPADKLALFMAELKNLKIASLITYQLLVLMLRRNDTVVIPGSNPYQQIYSEGYYLQSRIESRVQSIAAAIGTFKPTDQQAAQLKMHLNRTVCLYRQFNATRALRISDKSLNVSEILSLFVVEIRNEKEFWMVIGTIIALVNRYDGTGFGPTDYMAEMAFVPAIQKVQVQLQYHNLNFNDNILKFALLGLVLLALQ